MPTYGIDTLPPEVRMTEMHLDKDMVCAQWEGHTVRRFAVDMIEWFEKEGGPNYVAFDIHAADKGWFTLTMQRKEGRSPAQMAVEMKNKVVEAIRYLEGGSPQYARDCLETAAQIALGVR
jgi:hypothetical protein